MNNFFFLLSAAVIFAAGSANKYCDKKLCQYGKHIGCGHTGKFDMSCPKGAKMFQINNSLKQLLVDAHNAKRNIIAGGGENIRSPACRMATMQWDNELAALAALNVKQCKMAHDQCHNTKAFVYSGQNLAFMSSTKKPNLANSLKESVKMWFGEVKNTHPSFIGAFPENYEGPAIGHFTAMMVDHNTRLGCAASTYPSHHGAFNTVLVACNYATTNMISRPIYKKCNRAAESCTTGVNPKYRNLCSASEKYKVNEY